MRLLLLLGLVASSALAEPPPMSRVSLKKVRAVLQARRTPSPVERDALSLADFSIEVFGLDDVFVADGLKVDSLAKNPDEIYRRLLWELWTHCNRLEPSQKTRVAAYGPRLAPTRTMAVAWVQLHTDQVAEGRAAMLSRFDALVKGPVSWPPLYEAEQLLTCLSPHLDEAQRGPRRTQLDALKASIPPMPPG